MLLIKHFHFSSIRLPVSSKTDGKPKNQSVDPLILNHLGEWVSAYTFPDRWTNSTVSTVPTFLVENSLETTQAGFYYVTRSVTSYKPRAPNQIENRFQPEFTTVAPIYTTEPSYWSQWESEGMCTESQGPLNFKDVRWSTRRTVRSGLRTCSVDPVESCGGGTIIQRRFCSHPEMECDGPDYRTTRGYFSL